MRSRVELRDLKQSTARLELDKLHLLYYNMQDI